MNWLTKSPIAHRGLHEGFNIPENSISAFKNAIEKNYAIELDVRITKDNQIVVFHDKNLIRMCATKKKIRTQNYKAIKNIKLYYSDQTIPLLSDVLKLIKGQVPVIIEIKNYSEVGIFEDKLSKILDTYKGEFSICSFNPKVVSWFKDNKPNFIRGVIYGDIKKFQIKFYKLVFIYRFFSLRPHFVSLDYKLIDSFIPSFCRRFNTPIVSWTIDTKKKRRKAKRLVDNIIFENINPD